MNHESLNPSQTDSQTDLLWLTSAWIQVIEVLMNSPLAGWIFTPIRGELMLNVFLSSQASAKQDFLKLSLPARPLPRVFVHADSMVFQQTNGLLKWSVTLQWFRLSFTRQLEVGK